MYIGMNPETFPQIRKYFPDCFYGIVEAVSTYLYDTSPFDRIFSFHTFLYSKKGKELSLQKGSISLNACFSRDDSVMTKVPSYIKKYYGVACRRQKFHTFSEFEAHVIRSLEEKKPVITDFNMGYVEGLWSYKTFYDPHAIVIIGMDKGETVHAFDQTLGHIRITYEDFKECFHYNRKHYKAFRVYNLSHTGLPERKLDQKSALRRIRHNLKNLRAESSRKGFQAIAALTEDLSRFTQQSKAEGAYLQEIWEFSLDRYMLPLFIKQMADDLEVSLPETFRQEMEQLFSELFNKWLAVVLLFDKNFIQYKVSNYEKILTLLKQIYPLERQTIHIWEQVEELIKAQTVEEAG